MKISILVVERRGQARIILGLFSSMELAQVFAATYKVNTMVNDGHTPEVELLVEFPLDLIEEVRKYVAQAKQKLGVKELWH